MLLFIYRTETPTMKTFLQGKNLQAHIYLSRIPLEEVPDDETECAEWLLRLFEQKVISSLLNIAVSSLSSVCTNLCCFQGLQNNH